jgi:uncharacterized Tic20 family protein
MKINSIIDKYKVRLIVKGFRQKESMNYFDTYLLVSIITSIRILIIIAVINKLEIHQMNFKINFLNGDLDEEVYME